MAGEAPPAIHACHACGQIQRVPAPLPPGLVARCVRCGTALRRSWAGPLDLGLALAVASLVLLIAGGTQTLAVVEAAGQQRSAVLTSGPIALADRGLWELGALVFATTVVAPALMTLASLYVFAGLRLPRSWPGLRTAFAWRNRLRPWSMIEIFLVGYFVAYAKLGDLVSIEPGPGFWALFALMIATVATDAFVDPVAVWAAIARRAPATFDDAAQEAAPGSPDPFACPTCRLACAPTGRRCPRCGTTLERRKPDSVARAGALATASLVLYLPANLFPALTVIQLGRGSPSTILGGVWELLAARQWPLAAIVFTASVAVPVLKLIGLAVMIAVVIRARRSRHLRQLTGLYRVVASIGRWSMIDIFMESILAALVQFGAVATIDPGGGAIAFAAVVVLTMIAAEAFDPRLMWDAAA